MTELNPLPAAVLKVHLGLLVGKPGNERPRRVALDQKRVTVLVDEMTVIRPHAERIRPGREGHDGAHQRAHPSQRTRAKHWFR